MTFSHSTKGQSSKKYAEFSLFVVNYQMNLIDSPKIVGKKKRIEKRIIDATSQNVAQPPPFLLRTTNFDRLGIQYAIVLQSVFIRLIACVGSGDPVRVLRLYTTNTLDEVCSIYC